MITYLLRLLLLAFLVLGAITALRRLAGAKHRNKPAPKDKQADLWTGMSEHFEQLDQDLAAAKHWSRDELALAIEQYVFKLQHSDEDNTNLLQRITQQSDTAVPMVLKMLGNPDMQTRLRKEPRGEPALYRACQLLMEQPSERAIPYVRKLLAASNDTVTYTAFYWLGSIANKSTVADLLKGLQCDQPAQISRIAAGLLHGKHSPKSYIATQLFEPLGTLLAKYPDDCSDTIPELLLSWNPSKALTSFELAGILQPTHPRFAKTLDSMRRSRAWLPREHLLSLWQGIESETTKSREATVALQMLACHKHEEDQRLLLHILDRTDPSSSAAAMALLTFHDIDDWVINVSAKQRGQRSTAAQAALCIWDYTSNMQAGGHSRYFFNSGGNDWQLTIDSLRRAGDNQRADVLTSATECFSPALSTDREVRRNQIAELSPAQSQRFADADKRYAQADTPPETIITRFILVNLSDFH